MKRIWILLGVMMIMLSACGQKQAEDTLSWQEQYDLGVRYLSEGNYEEAIIAFTAAIEIDSKRPEAYISLADAYIGSGDYDKANSIIQQGREACGELEGFLRLADNLSFLQSGDIGIRITEFYFDRQAFLAGEETEFLVSVAYRCPDGECILMIGANTEEPDSFRMMDEDYMVTGSGGYQFHVSVAPVQWDHAYFGIYVNLSEADHAETWTPFDSDTLYIDPEGNVVGGNPSTKNNKDSINLLAVGDNGGVLQSVEEISFFGHSVDDIDIETMRSLMIANGFEIDTNEDNFNNALDPVFDDDFLWIQGSSDGGVGDISAMQYFSDDYVCLWGYDDHGITGEFPLPIGVRNISMRDSLETVLFELGFINADEISDYIYSVAQQEYGSDPSEWPDELRQSGDEWPHLNMEYRNYRIAGNFGYSVDDAGNQTSGFFFSNVEIQVYLSGGTHSYSLRFSFDGSDPNEYDVGHFTDHLARFDVNAW